MKSLPIVIAVLIEKAQINFESTNLAKPSALVVFHSSFASGLIRFFSR
jgi:hypothetical protein